MSAESPPESSAPGPGGPPPRSTETTGPSPARVGVVVLIMSVVVLAGVTFMRRTSLEAKDKADSIRAAQMVSAADVFQRPQAPPHNRPMIEREGKSLLWGSGDPASEEAVWFDMTDALVDPKTFQYGVGKDKIAAIDEPRFVKPDDPLALQAGIGDSTVVFGYAAEGVAKAYSVAILNSHELVNDRFGVKPVTVGW